MAHIYDYYESFLGFIDQTPALHNRKLAENTAFKTTKIHLDKMEDFVARGLEERRLARNYRWPWIEVEEQVAATFLSTLAFAAARLLDLTPVTDQPRALGNFATGESAKWERSHLEQGLRAVILNKVLPAPSGDVSVASLLRFKERHGDALRLFRLEIEQQVHDLAQIAEMADRELRTQEVARDDQYRVQLIAKELGSHFGNVNFGTVMGIAMAVTSAQSAVEQHNVAMAGISLLGVGGALYSALSNPTHAAIRKSSGYAYAALAQRKYKK